jgi:hypothetical protein
MIDKAIDLNRAIQIWIRQHSTALLRMFVVPFILYVSSVLAVYLNGTQARMFIALPFLLVGVVALFKWPQLGLIILLAGSLMSPEEIIQQLGITTNHLSRFCGTMGC